MITGSEQFNYIVKGKGEGKTQTLLHKAYLAAEKGNTVVYIPHDRDLIRDFRLDYECVYKRSCPVISKNELRGNRNKPITVLIDNFELFEDMNSIFSILTGLIQINMLDQVYITITGKVG